MNNKNQLLCIWSALVFIVLFSVGWWPIAGFIPPHAPALTAEQIAALYQDGTGWIRTGLLLMVLASGFYVPFVAAVATQIKRINGAGNVLVFTQLGAGVMVAVLLIVPPLIFSVAAYRPERAPELTLLLNDLGWICLIMPASPAIVQALAIGVATLSDKSAQPVFPRWMGYASLWVAVIFLPGLLITYFKSGAFAWNGLLAFWLPVLVFLTWIVLVAWMCHRALGNQGAADSQLG